MRYRFLELFRFVKDVFIAMGCDTDMADDAATSLMAADLRGVDSHGVARLAGYVRLWEKGRIKIPFTVKTIHETVSTATIDGGSGLGQVAGQVAMNLAIEKAKKVGSGWVAVKNSNHFGLAGFYTSMALEHNMIGIAMTNASPLVAPFGSMDRMLGTNPVSVAIPAGKEDPFLLDMATTTAANGKLEILMRKKKPAPEGWIMDKEGKSTTDADAVKKGGSLLPLGSDKDHGAHKGYGMGAMVDILSGVLSGANYGPWVPPFVAFLDPLPDLPGQGIGHFFGALRIDGFRPEKDFLDQMDNWIRTMRNARPLNPEEPVLIPGDIERITSSERLEKGIELLPEVEKDLANLALRFSISKIQSVE